jgi:GT2 family glycosyltransferase
MQTSAVIVNWNSGTFVQRCVRSVLEANPNIEVVVVDNASTDASFEALGEFRDRIDLVWNSVNRGFAAAVNQGFSQTSTPFVLILNPDTWVPAGSVALLESFLLEHPRAGAVGGYINDRYLPRRLPTVARLVSENLGLIRNEFADAGGGPVVQVEQPAAAALMVRRDAFDAVGGFDEGFFPAWYEDVDFCARLKTAGWPIYFARAAEFKHEGGYSAQALGATAFAEAYYGNQLRYAKKHFNAAGQLIVRASIALGMIIRSVARPANARAYGRVLYGVLGGW